MYVSPIVIAILIWAFIAAMLIVFFAGADSTKKRGRK
jgi:hypothetical protein